MTAEPVWSVEAEAARLADSLRGLIPAAAPAPDGAPLEPAPADPFESGEGPAPQHTADCGWCPVCRGARVLREVNPEFLERLADLAAFAATALGDLAERQAERQAERPAERPAARPAEDRAER